MIDKSVCQKPLEQNRTGAEYDYVWFMKKKLLERKGHPCRVISNSEKKEILVEFKDGYRIIATKHALRRTPPPQIQLNLDSLWLGHRQ